jgi:hypothetical protein
MQITRERALFDAVMNLLEGRKPTAESTRRYTAKQKLVR